ncbi:DUF4230 domain-containing protein [Streptomyces sp. NPDC093085]|uniref:DUF4230 domain-containing protein n=1 Tax=Streptomyces sp. NPDC093085 TaxID=3155068 RepID=UPI00343F9C1D
MTSTDAKPGESRGESQREGRDTARSKGLSGWVKAPLALVVVAGLLFLGSRLDLLPGFGGLLGEESHDRTGPTLLQSIQDLDRYEAASGNFQVVVDLEKDTKYLPDAIRGSRTLYVGAGTVGSYVDFGSIGDGNVTVDEDRTAATITLPHARLGTPAMDPDRSYAVSKQRGLLDRLGDLFSDNPADERAVLKLAAQHIGEAAKESELTGRAEKNTTAMLQGLLHSLGFTEVKVVYT